MLTIYFNNLYTLAFQASTTQGFMRSGAAVAAIVGIKPHKFEAFGGVHR